MFQSKSCCPCHHSAELSLDLEDLNDLQFISIGYYNIIIFKIKTLILVLFNFFYFY